MSGAHPDPSYLHQTVLVILRFPPEGVTDALSATDESYINCQLAAVSDFLWTNSNQSLMVTFEIIKVLQSLAASDYEGYTFTLANGDQQTLYAANYNATVQESLARRLVDPRQYAGVVMIYRPTNAPGPTFYNTWIWFDNQPSNNKRNPGLSSIYYGYDTQPPLSQYILHEYCHQLHHRFQYDAQDSVPAVPSMGGLLSYGFVDSDWMTKNQNGTTVLTTIAQYFNSLLGTNFQPGCEPGCDPEWLATLLKYYVGPSDAEHPNGTLHAVNYRWLEGRWTDHVVLGVFNGGELKEKYDFAQPDDVLVYVRGDNITRLNPPDSPGSFWFSATPGGTAAFGTQTDFSRYLISEVAFQYVIAPGDFTFQVHLVYYDNNGAPVDQRIDDGVFVLGGKNFHDKIIKLPIPQEVEDFQIVFQKGNQFTPINEDWVRLANITLKTSMAP